MEIAPSQKLFTQITLLKLLVRGRIGLFNCNMVRALQKYSTIMGFGSCMQYCGCDGVVGSYPLD